MQLSPEDKKNLDILKRYPEWSSLDKLLRQYLEEIKNVMTVGSKDVKVSVETEVYGRQWAYKALTEFLNTIKIIEQQKPKKQTYE